MRRLWSRLRAGWRRTRAGGVAACPSASAPPFAGSQAYWQQRYAEQGNSGAGSYGQLAAFKADVLNRFVAAHDIQSVIEYGCGDGHQLSLATYPRYLGFDVSPDALARCRTQFDGDATKAFRLVDAYAGETAELTLSLDVVFHLVEDEVFEAYMDRLFASATRFVIVYSSDTDEQQPGEAAHVRHRAFTRWVAAHQPAWRLIEHVPNAHPYSAEHPDGSFADFYIFARTEAAGERGQ